jgi:hypothetical protein
MNSSNNSALSKDTFFKVQSKTSITSINSISLEELSVAKAKEALQKILNNKSISQISVTKRVEV